MHRASISRYHGSERDSNYCESFQKQDNKFLRCVMTFCVSILRKNQEDCHKILTKKFRCELVNSRTVLDFRVEVWQSSFHTVYFFPQSSIIILLISGAGGGVLSSPLWHPFFPHISMVQELQVAHNHQLRSSIGPHMTSQGPILSYQDAACRQDLGRTKASSFSSCSAHRHRGTHQSSSAAA